VVSEARKKRTLRGKRGRDIEDSVELLERHAVMSGGEGITGKGNEG